MRGFEVVFIVLPTSGLGGAIPLCGAERSVEDMARANAACQRLYMNSVNAFEFQRFTQAGYPITAQSHRPIHTCPLLRPVPTSELTTFPRQFFTGFPTKYVRSYVCNGNIVNQA